MRQQNGFATLGQDIADRRLDTVDARGDVFNVTQRRLVNAPCDIPIVLAASGPKMLRLAGSDADGVIISGATSAPFVENCLARVAAGAQIAPGEGYELYSFTDPSTGLEYGTIRPIGGMTLNE